MFLLSVASGFAASPDDLTSTKANEAAAQPPSTWEDRPITWKSLAPDIVRDQRPIWTFPAQLARGEDWKPTLAIGAIFAGLVVLDPHVSPQFRNNSSFSEFNRVVSASNSEIAFALVPVSLYAIGTLHKNSYATHTSLLTLEAVADSEILGWVSQTATGRLRPRAVPPGGDYSNTWFKTYHPLLHAGGSFPSTHALGAFSIATIVAHRYKSHRWVPFVAYGAATVVSFSRVSEEAHFPSDVFVGAALGYVISRFVVMPGREPED
jgi:membrane-associated phospholipid phosphatase